MGFVALALHLANNEAREGVLQISLAHEVWWGEGENTLNPTGRYSSDGGQYLSGRDASVPQLHRMWAPDFPQSAG